MEKYLLDTHTLLWYLLDDENLSKKAKEIIDKSECYFSKVSLWEIAIKQSLGKLRYKESIISITNYCKQESFFEIPITEKDFENIKSLPFIHNDPFDRLLIAQAQNSNLTLITKDMYISQYEVKTLW
ncbi:MAG: type II toxin-antitoxin system VapC family toxin [Treponema sp.]|nr:type II toxin-antitoxin system VapC family toxin [Treponema sp.]